MNKKVVVFEIILVIIVLLLIALLKKACDIEIHLVSEKDLQSVEVVEEVEIKRETVDLTPHVASSDYTFIEEIAEKESIYDITTDEEFDLFCKVVEAEIGIGNLEQKTNVASSILNRYYDDGFPDTIEDVLLQPVQYSTVLNDRINRVEVTDTTIQAIENAFDNGDTVNGATYFYSGNSSEWHDNNLIFVTDDGLHKFLKEE